MAFMLDPARMAEYVARSNPKKERKAKLDYDNGLLLAFLRLLVYKLSEESHNLKQWVGRSQVLQEILNPPKRARRYFYIASRLLGLGVDADKAIPGISYAEIYYKMRNDWKYRLFKSTGLPVMDPDGLREFRHSTRTWLSTPPFAPTLTLTRSLPE